MVDPAETASDDRFVDEESALEDPAEAAEESDDD